MRVRITAILAIGLTTASAALADAPRPSAAEEETPKDAAASIAEARRAVEDQRYDDALALLAPLLSSRSRAHRAAALEITAVVRLLVGKAAEGREAVASLYEMAPAFELDDPSLPPRVTRVFEAEAAIPHARAVTLSVRASEAERGLFDVAATEGTASIDLACASGKASFSPVAVTHTSEGFRFRLPTLAPHRCFAIARDADALPQGRLGSAAKPFDVIVPPPPKVASIYARWWFWTGIGAVAAAAVGAGIAASLAAPGAPPAADLTLRPAQAVLSW